MYVETLRKLPSEAIHTIRKWENVKKKIMKCKWSIVYIDTWINKK